MSVIENVGLLLLGVVLGHLFPHILSIIMTRSKSSNKQFPAHPQPIPLSAELNRRILDICLLYTSPSPRDGLLSRMPSSA